MPVEVDYTISAAGLYRSLVMNFIRQDKNLDILTMCRNFDPDMDGGHQTASERLTSETISGFSGMLQLLVLNTRSMFQGSAPKEPETGHEDQGRAQNHTAENMNTQAPESSKQAQTRLHSENKSKSDSDNPKAEGTATVPGAPAPESNDVDAPRSEQVLPSWVPRWNINELHPGVQIALDPRRLASCSSSGSHEP